MSLFNPRWKLGVRDDISRMIGLDIEAVEMKVDV